MGKQIGIIPLQGSADNLTFYKSQDGIMFKKKSVISKDKFQNSASFELQRRNGKEFGLAGKAGKLLTDSVSATVKVAKDGRVASRLLTVLLAAARKDTVNPLGQRNVMDGDLHLLSGFEFNVNASLKTAFTSTFTTGVDRPSGK